jgi:NSS family neurotransmitter:Na+ symporter
MEQWQSRSTFVFALAAAAVGLGNVWRFAYLLGDNGGGPFMLAYLLSLVTLSVPVMVAEVVVGVLGRRAPAGALVVCARRARRSPLWGMVAAPAYAGAFLLLLSALVVGSWCLRYAFHHQLGSFAAISMGGARDFFTAQIADPLGSAGWLALALMPLALATFGSVRRGLALVLWLSIPTISVLLAVVIDFSVEQGDLAAAGEFLFSRQALDFSDRSVLLAAGQAFFTLGIGAGVGMVFGAHAPGELPVARSVLAVALFDVVIAVAMGIAIFPLLFASNVAPSQGMGLLFMALPYAFGNLGLGDVYGTLFFSCVFVITQATALALLEPLVSQLQSLGLRRVHAAPLALGAAAVLALVVLQELGDGGRSTLLASAEGLTAGLLLPLTALLTVLFCGWMLPRRLLRRALAREPDTLFSLWYFLLRFWVPPALVLLWVALRLSGSV